MKKIITTIIAVVLVMTFIMALNVAAAGDSVKYYDENGNLVVISSMYYDGDKNPVFGSRCYYIGNDGNPVYVDGSRAYCYDEDGNFVPGRWCYDADGNRIQPPAGGSYGRGGGCCGRW